MVVLKVYYKDSQNMEEVEDNSIDLVITSPPYNIGIDYGDYKDNLPHGEYLIIMNKVVKECYRVMVSDGRIAININHVIKDIYDLQKEKQFPIVDFLTILLNNGFNIREIITWFKATDENHFSGGSTAWGSWCSASNPHMRGQIESIVVANKGSWKKESGSQISDITANEFKLWTKSAWFFHAESKRDHPAPFPLELPKRLIKLYSFVGDTILDPFLGSGTTLQACRELKRNCIGYEIDKKYKRLIEKKSNLHIPEIESF